jgi:aryl-alcohol dehydrogenase-like predicted oxidoreductase
MASPIPSRPLGKNGPVLPRLGLGLMNNSGAYNAAGSDEERLAFLDKAYEIGERFWDTANMYLDSEDLLGKWFARNPEKRKDVFLATKFAIDMTVPTDIKINSSPEYARQQLTKSLSRLGLAYVDLYYVHRIDGKTPIEKTIEALVEMKKEGKLKYIGLSGCSATTLRRAHTVHPIAAVQMEYSLFARDIEATPASDPRRAVLATARELGVAVVAYSPLGRGILTGGISGAADLAQEGDMRRGFGLPWFQEGNLEKNLATVAQIGEVAKAKGVTTPQLCLAWVLAQGDDVFAIPGTRKAERLQQNLQSLDIVLSADDEKKLRALGEQVAGGRSRPEHLALDFGDSPEL